MELEIKLNLPIMNKLLTPIALCAISASAHAALTAPSGLDIIKDWNFDGDGAPEGTVDSGASATDWTKNSWESVQNDGGVSNIYSGLQNDANLYVNTTYTRGDVTGALTYGQSAVTSNRGFDIELGDTMTSGFIDYNALLAQTSGSSNTYSSKVTLWNGSTRMFEFNMRQQNQLRYLDADGSTQKTISTTSADLSQSNQFQLSWDSDSVDIFFGDNANSSANEVTLENLAFIGNISGGVTKISFTANTSGATVDTTLENLYIAGATAAVPEPSASALFGLGGLTLLARRRR